MLLEAAGKQRIPIADDSRTVTATGLTQLQRVTEMVGIDKWTLRFKDPAMEKVYMQNCIERRVYTSILTKISCIYYTIGLCAQTGDHFLFFWWFKNVSEENIYWSIYMTMVCQLASLTFLVMPFMFPDRMKNRMSFKWVFMICVIVSQICHKFIWEMTLMSRTPEMFIDYPVNILITVVAQTILCTVEGDFLSTLTIPAAMVFFRLISFSFYYLSHSPEQINYLINQSYSASWFTIAVDIPILFASTVSCVVIGYWFNLFARLRFFLSHGVKPAKKGQATEKSNLYATASYALESSKSAKATISSDKSNPATREAPTTESNAKETSNTNKSILSWLLKEYFESQKNLAFQEYCAKGLVSLMRQVIVPIVLSFCFNIVSIHFLTTGQKAIIAIAYALVLLIVVYFQSLLLSNKQISTTLRVNLINFTVIFIALLFHVPFLVSAEGASLSIFSNIVKTAVMLNCTLSSLAGLQTRTSIIYFIILCNVMFIRLIIEPWTFDSKVIWSYFILYLASSQFSMFLTFCIEMQLYQFFKSSPTFKQSIISSA